MDAAISPGPSDTRTDQVELPCHVDDVAIDGIPPETGDTVEVTLKANVTRVVNDIAWLEPVSLNNKPLPEVPMEKNDDLSELDRQYELSKTTTGGGSTIPNY
jgi:hypothetical protein